MQYAIKNDIINLSFVQEQIALSKRKELLEKHPFRIWEGRNGSWYTYLPGEKSKRILKKRSTKQSIEDFVCDYWKEKTENPTIHEIFNLWISKKLKYKEIQKGSADRYETDFIRFFVESEFSKHHIKQVTEDDIEDFVRTQIAEHELTAKTYSGLRIIIKGIFQYAKKQKWTTISISEFFADLDISRNTFKKKIKDVDNEVLAEDEIPKIVNYLKADPTVWNLGVLLALQTGLRVGELAALKRDD